jgi:hypothetical protein
MRNEAHGHFIVQTQSISIPADACSIQLLHNPSSGVVLEEAKRRHHREMAGARVKRDG